MSSDAPFTICTPPSAFLPPVVTSVSLTSMTLSWSAPASSGGCPITSYHIFKDDGNGGLFAEVSPLLVNSIPSLRSFTINFSSAQTSLTFRFYMTVDNSLGSYTTNTVSYILAAVPGQPPTTPTIDLSQTTAHQIAVNYPALGPSENGGSDILSYEL